MRCSRTDLAHAARVLLLATCLTAAERVASQSVEAPASAVDAARIHPVEVLLNGTPGGIWPVLERGGLFYAPAEAFENWRMDRAGELPAVDHRGLRYFQINALPGADVKLDLRQNSLVVNVSPEVFAATRLARSQAAAALPRSPAIPSAFLNYDVSYTRQKVRGLVTPDLGFIGEAGLSNSLGVFTTTFVGRDLDDASTRRFLRLESTFRRDFPDKGYTLHLGDGTLRTGYLGRPAYFGGVQVMSNFGLAPHVNRQPVPVVGGETRAPSVVQLYVNDVLRQTTNVPAGPFTIDTLTQLTGNGNVSVVVRDILGRETVITQPFFITADLLAPGLNDWSAEAGVLRKRMGEDNARYSEGFASGMWRRGISTTTTGELRLELSRELSSVGAAGVMALGGNAQVRAGLLASRDALLGSGQRWMLGVDWQSRQLSLQVSGEGSTRDFRSLGETRGSVAVRLQLAAQASYAFSRETRMIFSLALQDRFDAERVLTTSLGLSTVLREDWLVNLGWSRAYGSRLGSGSAFSASLNVPLDRRTNVAFAAQTVSGRPDIYGSVSRSPESTYGTAWRLLAGRRDEPRGEGSVYHFTPHGTVSAEASATPRQSGLRLGGTGALVMTEGLLFATNRHDQAAVLVHVPGYANVGVGVGSTPITRTDKAGYALVPRLNPYQSSPIQLDPNDLPVTAEIDNIEREVVPAWRSVAKAQFEVRGGRAAVLRIVLDDGEPAPAGATVNVRGEPREYIVGRRGEAYVTGLAQENEFRMTWEGRSCQFRATLPAGTADDVPRVGPIVCSGVKR